MYMPMTPHAVYAMLACARIGAIHNIVFAGFSAEAVRSRINNAGCKFVFTADEVGWGSILVLNRCFLVAFAFLCCI